MQVKLKTTLAGPKYQGYVGKTVDLPKAMAYDLIEAGSAEQVMTEKELSAAKEAAADDAAAKKAADDEAAAKKVADDEAAAKKVADDKAAAKAKANK